MMKRIIPYILTLSLILLLAACSTTKRTKTTSFIGNLPEEAYMEELFARNGSLQQLSAKMVLQLDMKGKNGVKLSGTLRLKRNEGIQISIAPLLGIEVARIEITPHQLLALDRMNKRYVELSFEDLKAWTHTDLDFYSLQALFFNEIFLPGKKELTNRDIDRFELSLQQKEEALLQVKQSKYFIYQFLTAVNEGTLLETHIKLKNSPYHLQWNYNEFSSLSTRSYPTQMQATFEAGSETVVAHFGLSRLSTDGGWQMTTEVPKRYEKVDLPSLLKILINE
ncbi:MAG: DUF4292 domain-containing protein [Phocaeicola sp.]